MSQSASSTRHFSKERHVELAHTDVLYDTPRETLKPKAPTAAFGLAPGVRVVLGHGPAQAAQVGGQQLLHL